VDLVKHHKPDGGQAKMRTETRKWYAQGAMLVREAERQFDSFLKELELSGYRVERGRHALVDMTAEFARIRLEPPRQYWAVGMGTRLDFYVVWAVFYVANESRGPFGPSTGTYEKTFKDAQDAMDWVIDYIRSLEETK